MNTLTRLKEYLDFKGISIMKAEQKISASNGSLGSQIRNNKTIGNDKIENILSVFDDLNPTWLLTGKGDMLLQSYKQVAILEFETTATTEGVPLYELEASAGIVSLFMDSTSEKPIDYIRIPNLPKCDGAVYVAGDSMYPLLKTRDVVMYKKIDDVQSHIFIWGEMYLVAFENSGDEYVTVKWMQKSKVGSDHICLVSENRHHEPIDVPKKSIRALAVIKASLRINSMQ